MEVTHCPCIVEGWAKANENAYAGWDMMSRYLREATIGDLDPISNTVHQY